MPIKLYYEAASPSARAVLLTLKTLNIPHEICPVNVEGGETRTPEYLKMNPQHTVPVIVDEYGFVVIDSHAINAYLADKYAKDDGLYPKDVKARSVVNHRLHFDNGVLFQASKFVVGSYLRKKTITGLTPEIVNSFEDAYGSLEKFLSATGPYIAGKQVTIADFSILSTLALTNHLFPVKEEKFPKLAEYIELGNANIPFLADLNATGIQVYKADFKDFNFELIS